MRYYLYLDKDFLKSLFSVIENAEFNIDVFEFTVRNSYTLNNNMSLSPSIEKSKDSEDFSKKDFKENYTSTARDSNANRKRFGISYDNGNSYNYQTERKYLNISDITDMKNIAFYHDILEKIKNNMRDENDSRIYNEVGFVKSNKNRDMQNGLSSNLNGNFFMINDTFIWYEKDKLKSDIELLEQMSCKIHVIGYKMNCDENDSDNNMNLEVKKNNILKAIAIYIE